MEININTETNELLEDRPSDFEWELIDVEKIGVLYTYVVDEEAVIDTVFVKEYPNGGKDYKEVVTSPEKGHFDVSYINGGEFPYHINVPEDLPHEFPTPDVIDVNHWRRLTEKDIEQREIEREKNDIYSIVEDLTLTMADILGGAVK